MSEPLQKGDIDLKSLDHALNDAEAASDLPAETLKENSDTLAQPAADARPTSGSSDLTPNAQKASSPATLSPSSPRAMSPVHVPARTTSADMPPAVAELKVMFPDLDNDTIGAVLSSRGGDQEAAVNALLQMSDPSFKPSTTETRTDSDALLAQTIAMEEEQRHHDQMARQQQQRINQSAGRGGGGAGSFFSGLLGSDTQAPAASSAPSYDPNALTYQPRVRRAGAPAAHRTSYAPPNHPPAASPSYADGESIIPGMPGAKEAKQWQEEINRMAETGLARAASTFSSFRQKATAAFNAPQDGSAQSGQAAPASGGAGSSGSGFAQAFQNFRGGAGRGGGGVASQERDASGAGGPGLRGFTSPRSPHASEYDQDPSPVSENELAKIISRGGGGSAAGVDRSGTGKARALADRYGLGIKGAGRTGTSGSSNLSTAGDAASSDASDFAGWDQAGRTSIAIKDNTIGAASTEPKKEDAVARMDSARGRGITTPRSADATTGAAAAGAAGAAGVAAGAGGLAATTANAKHTDHDDANDSDDLEYVSNPFEDED